MQKQVSAGHRASPEMRDERDRGPGLPTEAGDRPARRA
jgi:hypothetical protein